VIELLFDCLRHSDLISQQPTIKTPSKARSPGASSDRPGTEVGATTALFGRPTLPAQANLYVWAGTRHVHYLLRFLGYTLCK
jgi:hypothetical protein